jgi:hypothetical protein
LREGTLAFPDSTPDSFDNGIGIAQDAVIVESQDAITFFLKPTGSLRIVLSIAMIAALRPIELDHQLRRRATEIGNVRPYWMLPAKTQPRHLLRTKQPPHLAFGARWFSAHRSGERMLVLATSGIVLWQAIQHPLPDPLAFALADRPVQKEG